jgi:hypothetical protein
MSNKSNWSKNNPEKNRAKARRFCANRTPEAYLLHSAKNNAWRRGSEITITLEDIIIPDVCPVLGIPLFKQGGVRTDNSPSLDRLDNTKGYIKGNVWVISWRANKLKGEGTLAELEALVLALKQHMSK